MNQHTPVPTQSEELADDLLRGASEIAKFIFGEHERGGRRQIYYLAEHSRLPVFRLGSMLCARRSVLIRWIAAQEDKANTVGRNPDVI